MKIGIMGGTFDPVHNGHIEMAEFCCKKFGLDRVLFLPAGDPPHKTVCANAEIRLEMLCTAAKSMKNAKISRMEIDREGTTYTIDSLNELIKNQPSDEFFYIIGEDTLNTLDTWRRFSEVAQLVTFLVVLRDSANVVLIEEKISELKRRYGARCINACHRGMNVSSTEIRENIKNGKSIKQMVPAGVEEIIKKYGIYR